MKKTFAKTVTLIMLAASLGACANMTQTQRNTAAGAVLGGVAGNLIGGDTGSTLGGAALGGVIGSQSSYPLLILYSVKKLKRPSECSDGLLFCGLFVDEGYTGQLRLQNGSAQSSQCFRSDKVAAIGQNDTAVRCSAFKRDNTEKHMVVFRSRR